MSSVKLPTNKPTTLVIHGANFVGEQLTELLTTQKSHVVIVDEFTKDNRDTIKKLKKDYGVTSFDLSGIETLGKQLKRVDYIIVLLNQFLLTNENFSSKRFLSETNIVDTVFKLALNKNAKVLLGTTVSLHRKLVTTKGSESDKLSDVSKQRPYTPLELQRYCENLAAEYHDQSALNTRIVRLGEVIGEGMPLEANTKFVDMVKEAITKPRITIEGEGLDYTYYVHVLDAVYGIIKALFSGKTNGEVFSLSYEDEISTLSMAYKVLELNPKAAEIQFIEAKESGTSQQTYVPAKNLGKIGWKPKIPFDRALLETVDYFHEKYKIAWKDKPELSILDKFKKDKSDKKTKEKSHAADRVTPLGNLLYSITNPIKNFGNSIRSKFSKSKDSFELSPKLVAKYSLILAVVAVLYFFLIGPIIQVAAGTGFAYYYGKKAYAQAGSLEMTAASKSLDRTSYFTSLANDGWEGLFWIKYIPGLKQSYTETEKIFEGAEHLSKGGQYLTQGFEPYAEYFKNFEPTASFEGSTSSGSNLYNEELEAMEDSVILIKNAQVEISLAAEAFGDVDTSVYPNSIEKKVDRLIQETEKVDETVDTAQNFAGFLPDILGKDGRQTYIVLFQNPMELRSTGGWLTSYAVVGIEYGQVRELEVNDVYTTDGQLTERVEPPASMQEALGTTDWKLSLSNWSPDFPQSAEAAEYFLKQSGETTSIDGVIAVDLEYVRGLIDIWGEIEIPGEAEPVTSDNMYDKVIEIHREFTPGSTQKPAFLSNLANEIMKKTLQSPSDSWADIASVSMEALNEKHLLAYMHNTSFNQFLDDQDWGGQLNPETNIVYPVEWNDGGNKANHFITRSTELDATITDENTVQQKLTINYENSSTQNKYPEGVYENYIRIYLPRGSKMIRVEGIESTDFETDSGANLEVLSGWVRVPVKSKTSISISYKLERGDVSDFPVTIEPGGLVSYRLNMIKQPGLDADDLTVEVTYPEQWIPTDLVDIHRELNTLSNRSQLDTDQEFEFKWEKSP